MSRNTFPPIVFLAIERAVTAVSTLVAMRPELIAENFVVIPFPKKANVSRNLAEAFEPCVNGIVVVLLRHEGEEVYRRPEVAQVFDEPSFFEVTVKESMVIGEDYHDGSSLHQLVEFDELVVSLLKLQVQEVKPLVHDLDQSFSDHLLFRMMVDGVAVEEVVQDESARFEFAYHLVTYFSGFFVGLAVVPVAEYHRFKLRPAFLLVGIAHSEVNE